MIDIEGKHKRGNKSIWYDVPYKCDRMSENETFKNKIEKVPEV